MSEIESGNAASKRLRAELDRLSGGRPWSRQTYLRDGVFTVGDRPSATDFRLRWLLQLASDATRGNLGGLRVLDLGCEEGHFGLEFARHGAEVVAVDARESHLRRARFMAEAVGATGYEAIAADVRTLDAGELGQFDLILCLGLHYHLYTPELFEFFATLSRLCRWAVHLYGQCSLVAREARTFNGHEYWGKPVFEHSVASTSEDRLEQGLASVDNVESFWLTKPSTINLLADNAFTSVCEHVYPRTELRHEDRLDLLAFKGVEAEVLGMPGSLGAARPRWPEHERQGRDPVHTLGGRLRDCVRRSGLGARLRRRSR